MDELGTPPIDAPMASPIPIREGIHAAGNGSNLARWIVWLVLAVGFALFLLVARVRTYLGVKVQPTTTTIGGYLRTTYDKNGHEYVWRVWWRARHHVLQMGPNWGFPLLLAILTALFIVTSVAAVWLALVPNEMPIDTDGQSDLDFSATR